ncbi:MAG: hypothetical protein E6230_20265 [Paenibacillus dendritiformis]|nr:hypothetical protein [Paenibacillus dendritiformis]MDU5144507.1 hypothetical protein [Paenibacillus dendritiformis]NKI22192.1 hypothetical protein [Paenibacillus dendritiformis]NRG00745.1 hypothetical protein [Paenibacillus dendritiformis]
MKKSVPISANRAKIEERAELARPDYEKLQRGIRYRRYEFAKELVCILH